MAPSGLTIVASFRRPSVSKGCSGVPLIFFFTSLAYPIPDRSSTGHTIRVSMIRGSTVSAMSRAGLTDEQNKRVREVVRELLLRDFDNSQSALARRLGVRQPAISRLLSGEAGTTYPMVQRLARLVGRPDWQILGNRSPLAELSARELAAELAGEIGVNEAAIESVLAEPVTPEREKWRALWWTDLMRRREMELLRSAAPSAPSHAPTLQDPTPRAKRKANG